MDDAGLSMSQTPDGLNGASKRKRSPSAERTASSAPPAKTAKMHNAHLQINYLTRLYTDDLALISANDTLPALLQLIGEYIGVLDRHESMVGNLGVRLLGPILIKRFERLFEGPPRVLKSHGKEGTNVTWLDVVDFARHKPEQFNLEKMRDGIRVCQFYTKQCRVEISEEDYVLIHSGMPQRLIPPQPIAEDEEKELGTLEILEKNIGQLVQLTDQVAGRARQLNHRIRNRKNAIVSRREAEAFPAAENGAARASPSAADGSEHNVADNRERRDSNSPTSGFVAVNSRPVLTSNNSSNAFGFDASKVQHAVSMNGKSYHGSSASPATRTELMNYFNNMRERANEGNSANDHDGFRASSSAPRLHSSSKPKSRHGNDIADYANILLNSASPVAIPNTPSNLQYKVPMAEKFDDSGPYKAEMLSRMDSMQRGDRVMPPCDRCRRLHMDCRKNLTACQGCTKKHAKCSWKDVSEQELLDNPFTRTKDSVADTSNGNDPYSPAAGPADMDGTPQGVPDEELLGEDSDDGDDPPSHSAADDDLPTSDVGYAPDLADDAPPSTATAAPPAPKAPMLTNGDLEQLLGANRALHTIEPSTAAAAEPAPAQEPFQAEKATMQAPSPSALDPVDQDSPRPKRSLPAHASGERSPAENAAWTRGAADEGEDDKVASVGLVH
ncbi:hypothetical protein MMC26_005179 [Xylographa opegraphella]|nr:hypothetical protein [Xylographa opegraphella]